MMNERRTVRDWIAALGAPAILVAGSYLGTISHTLTAAAALREAGAALDSIVVDESAGDAPPLAETADVIARFAGGTPVVPLSRSAGAAAWTARPAELLDRLPWP